jgi:hypothetical protein
MRGEEGRVPGGLPARSPPLNNQPHPGGRTGEIWSCSAERDKRLLTGADQGSMTTQVGLAEQGLDQAVTDTTPLARGCGSFALANSMGVVFTPENRRERPKNLELCLNGSGATVVASTRRDLTTPSPGWAEGGVETGCPPRGRRASPEGGSFENPGFQARRGSLLRVDTEDLGGWLLDEEERSFGR